MKGLLFFITIGVVSLLLSLGLTNVLIKILKNYNIVDVPSNRRVHIASTPRGGGIVFVLIFLVLFPLTEYYLFGGIERTKLIVPILLPIGIISFWDDLFQVSVPIRLLIHIICSFLAVMRTVPLPVLNYQIPLYLDFVFATFALLTFLNLYNFMDGIDGMTAHETIHLSLTTLILCTLNYDIILNVDMIIIIGMIILGWSSGFIYFNWQPAKIFAGDVGSISVGFLLGICLLNIAASSIKLFIAVVIAAAYYIADGGLTILIRTLKGEKIWEPHLQHFFQKAVKRGWSHKEAVVHIAKCNFLLMLLAINALYLPLISLIVAFIIVTITLIRLSV